MFTQQETYQNYILSVQKKTTAKWYITLLLAICAGAFIAIGGISSIATSATLSGSAATIVKGAVFPLGLTFVIFFGAELFTGNCLMLAPTTGRNIKVCAMLKNWGIVYLGNAIGSVLVAVITVYSGIQTDAMQTSITAAAAAKCGMNFGIALLRAIPCNILVCLAVWLSSSAKSPTGKFILLFLPIFAFVVCGFEHSIANMYYLTAGMLTNYGNGINVGNAILNCLIPTTIGNIIGGSLLALLLFLLYSPKSVNTDNSTTSNNSTNSPDSPTE